MKSREFWIFLASIVLLLSAIQIAFSTSVPVFNILLEPFDKVFSWLGNATGSEFLNTLATKSLHHLRRPLRTITNGKYPSPLL
ncbi:MAG: hypothetical protein IPI00_17755 [Flavobacteriales bacterium]|nr:hypothetical protein [Flavobacteriales bacterium]